MNAAIPNVFLMTDSFRTGGTERQFATVARALDPERFRVHLGCLQATGKFLDGFEDVRCFDPGGSLYRLPSLITRTKLARHLDGQDIAIAHSFDFYSNMMLIPAARMGRIPVVIGSQRQIGDLLTRAQSFSQRVMFGFCDRVVCNSRAAATRLVSQGLPQKKIAVIGNGLPTSAFSRVEGALPRVSGLLRVGMIARMNALYKNHHVFLNAAAKLCQSFLNVEFVLVGDGPLRLQLERHVDDLGIRGRVLFLGDRQDIPQILASLHISVIPSASESLSNVALESMAAGVPVVAASVGGNPEIVTSERGMLVPPNDETALCVSIGDLLCSSELRACLGENARHFAEANFTIERMRTQYEDLYSELLAQKCAEPRHSRWSHGSGKKLRVALVAPSLRYVGGQAVQADLFLRYWQDDPEVDAVFVPIDPHFPRGLQWAERVPFLRTIIREPIYLVRLWREMKKVDIAHIFSASYWSFLLGPMPAQVVAHFRGKKTLINYHSGEARDHLLRFRKAGQILKNADGLVVPSAYLVDVFRQFSLKAQIVPNVVDLSQFSFRTRNSLRPHLVCTRGFHPYYSVDVVVRAFCEVQKAFPEASLDLVGTGPLEQNIRSLVAKLGLEGVNFVGVVSRKEIGKFYDRADIFINASWLDNMPVSILEAFSCGTPVVSTAPDGIRYLVEHERTGLLCEPGDWRALADNVMRLLKDPALALRLAHNAFNESQRYHWERLRTQWLDVYRSLYDRAEVREGAEPITSQQLVSASRKR